MPVTFTPSARGHALGPDTYSAFETAVRAALGEIDEVVSVRFGVCDGDDGGARYVCKVETAPAEPFGDEQWRWWSPLFETPEELQAALRDALSRRQRGDARAGRPVILDPPPSTARAS